MTIQTAHNDIDKLLPNKSLAQLTDELGDALRAFRQQREKLLHIMHLPSEYPFLLEKGIYGNA